MPYSRQCKSPVIPRGPFPCHAERVISPCHPERVLSPCHPERAQRVPVIPSERSESRDLHPSPHGGNSLPIPTQGCILPPERCHVVLHAHVLRLHPRESLADHLRRRNERHRQATRGASRRHARIFCPVSMRSTRARRDGV